MKVNFKHLNILFLFALLISCNKIENTASLDKEHLKFLKSLKLLEENEVVYKFYSEYKKEVAGNFFTNKRIATYWIDEKNEKENKINSAYYNEIIKIDTVYYAGITYTPYLQVIKKNNDRFKVSVEGTKNEIKSFFEDAIKEWKKRRND